MSSIFEQATLGTIIVGGFTFDVNPWSLAANWLGGLPVDGSSVTVNVTVPGNPSGYDDIASLYLDSLAVDAGQIAVGGSLEIGSVSFGTANFPSVFSDTLLGSSAATLVVDGFSGSNYGEIGAFGSHALTVVQSLTDPGGETYQVDDGGELVLDPTPQYNSSITSAGFYYENSVATGTFGFRNPSAEISSPLSGVAIGDAIALPGTDVSSVTYGSSSITIVTNQGTVDFSDVGYSGQHPTGFVVTPDPVSGLERITFTGQQPTSFQQGQTTQIIDNGFTFGVYLWSTAANWTKGVPGPGAAVTNNITLPGNPSGYDDLADLSLNSLAITAGQIAVAGSLEIGSISFGTANFPSIYSDTLLGSSAATLVVDGFTGANYGEIGAFGSRALTVVQSLADPGGETYQVDDGGELLLDPTPQFNSSITSAGFFYQNSVASGTFAFRNPSGTIASPLGGVAIGDAIALPGTDVSSVTYRDVANQGTITVVTNLGTTVFDNVGYVPNEIFTGFRPAADPIGGLERITFEGDLATSFQQVQTTQIIDNGFTFGVYLWSTAANWTNGVPTNGGAVTHNVPALGNPSGYDDIANLYLNSLAITAGQVAVGGSLEIGTLSFGTANFPSVFSDTLLGSSAATLVVDGFSGSNYGEIGAFGQNALTFIESFTDTGGETYQVDDGGELVLRPTPQYNTSITSAGFFYENSVADGTFAFLNPGGTIAAPLDGAAIGDAIALPGTAVSSVTYGANSIVVVTNLGTTVFSNVGYSPNEILTGYRAAADPISGLERITFTGDHVTSFQQGQTTQIVENGFTFGVYLWSTAGNWTNGVPANGEAVANDITVAGNPSGYDDIAGLNLDHMTVTAGQIAVGGSLEIGTLSFGTANFPSVYSDTLLGSSSATLVVDGFGGSNYGEIGAFGTHALTVVQSATDPGGETYQADDGGELVLDPTPQYNSAITSAGLYYENSVASGTFAFRSPGGTIAAPLVGVEAGDAIALPGSAVSLVTYSDSAGVGTITVDTNLGATTFTDVYYASAEPTGFIATPDPIGGLERITFAQSTLTSFEQTTSTTVGGSPEYLWSNPTNWTNGVPVNGGTVTFNPSGTVLPSGYDDIGNLFLDVLAVDRGIVAVGGTLTIARLSFSEAGLRGIEADTAIAGGTAAVFINSLSNSGGGTIAAVGTNAVTTIQAPLDRGEVYQAINRGMVVLEPTPVATSHFTLAAGTIAFDNPGSTIAATLANVAVGDAIELPGTAVASVTFGPGTLTAVTNDGTTTFSNVDYETGLVPTSFVAAFDPSTGLEEITFTLCFCAGTQILTPQGEVPVEALAVGDLVLTASGAVRPITWIGTGRVLATPGARGPATPVIVRKGAIARNVPHRDLHVTKGHSLYIDDVLIPVEELINQRSILWDDRGQEVQIFHIELATHDVLLANGALAETYRDDGNRWLFRNANAGCKTEPQSQYAPVLNSGPVVDAAWRLLLERAGGEVTLTEDADLHLLVDGKRIDPIEQRDGMVAFRLAVSPRRARLVSRSGVPQELGVARDPRRLGVAVQRLVAAQGRRQRAIDARDERLVDGYHAFEASSGVRWTNGDAELPRALFTGLSGASMLLVHLGARTKYAGAEEVRRVA